MAVPKIQKISNFQADSKFKLHGAKNL